MTLSIRTLNRPRAMRWVAIIKARETGPDHDRDRYRRPLASAVGERRWIVQMFVRILPYLAFQHVSASIITTGWLTACAQKASILSNVPFHSIPQMQSSPANSRSKERKYVTLHRLPRSKPCPSSQQYGAIASSVALRGRRRIRFVGEVRGRSITAATILQWHLCFWAETGVRSARAEESPLVHQSRRRSSLNHKAYLRAQPFQMVRNGWGPPGYRQRNTNLRLEREKANR